MKYVHNMKTSDGNCIAVGSHDNYVYLFESSNLRADYKPIGKCAGHSSFITHLDFSDDGKVCHCLSRILLAIFECNVFEVFCFQV